MKKILALSIAILLSISTFAQVVTPVKWTFEAKTISSTEAKLILKAKIDKGWHIYSQNIKDGGPIPTTFTFKKSTDYALVGKVAEISKAIKLYEKAFEMDLIYFEEVAVFEQKIKISALKDFIAKGELEFMVCDESRCLPPEVLEFSIPVKILIDKTDAGTITPTDNASLNSDSNNTTNLNTENTTDTLKKKPIAEVPKKESHSLWWLFIEGLGWGFLALLTPCVFPMIPLTVSFFTKRAANRRKGIINASIYGLSIIAIYVTLGLLVSFIFGADKLNDLSSNIIFNTIFFLMLVVFGISFLGAFEIVLPNSFVNKIDSKGDTNSFMGIFFMAFTLALVSFSCTGPAIGGLLVDVSSKGELLGPAIGMFGFAFALAIPFVFFAIFPNMLASLPKSGGWLNSVKVTLGFLELAFSLKFLSTIDLAYHWGILDREVFLVIWIVLFFLLGIYLLGKLKFSHDSDLAYVSIPRLFFAIAAFSFSLYLVPGLWGAPLKAISGYAPPMGTQDYNVTSGGSHAAVVPINGTEAKKYANLFHCPGNLDCYFDLNQAIEAGKKANKPIFVDFTGHSCANCRKMEASVWSDKEVERRMMEDYIVVSLYVDDRTALPENEQYTSKATGKEIKTIGQKWSDLQISRYNVNAQPYYVLLDHNQNILTKPEAYNEDVPNYIKFLEAGKASFEKK